MRQRIPLADQITLRRSATEGGTNDVTALWPPCIGDFPRMPVRASVGQAKTKADAGLRPLPFAMCHALAHQNISQMQAPSVTE